MTFTTFPVADGFTLPPDWSLQEACWVAWPCAANLWQEHLTHAQDSFARLCDAIAEHETLHVLVPDAGQERVAREAIEATGVRFHHIPYGDIWLRDTGPLFLRRSDGERAAVCFEFNGWGNKYILPHDAAVSARIAAASGFRTYAFSYVLEGGSLEVDGEGTCLTTRQCLLNRNRNGNVTEQEMEERLQHALGVERVVWLDEGLLNDHTDGHIDTIVRFIQPGVVMCMEKSGSDDPNATLYDRLVRELSRSEDAKGRKLEVVRVPSPGLVKDDVNRVMPASYVNYFIGNGLVAVPTYGTRYDDQAVAAIAALFPTRKTIGIPAWSILTGGGAFHCITQQVPAGTSR